MDVVVGLGSVHRGMGKLVGGKAASLGELGRAGLPVPDGFCVVTDAYAAVAAAAGLDPVLEELHGVAVDDAERLGALAGEARRRLASTSVPTGVQAAVERAYADLGGGAGSPVPVAVRSSATAEDLPHASFAGQQDTYLNVVGAVAVLDAVRRCWASLWTERAVAYRAAAGVDQRSVRLAVVVQRLVDARVAGVMFTANPVTGRRRQAVIDASPGLGESVVSGAVDPDHIVADLDSGRVESRELGGKRTVVRPLPGGGTDRVPAETDQAGSCLDDEQVAGLVALGRRVEAHYGGPQDTEWAIDAEGRSWLTQARPITNLFPLPAGAPDPADGLRVYFCFSVAQGVERPVTPVGLAVFRQLATAVARTLRVDVPDPSAGPQAYAEAGMRVFVDATRALRSKAGRQLVPRLLDVMEARSAVLLRSLFDDPRLGEPYPSVRPVLRVVRALARMRVPPRLLAAVRDPDAGLRRVERLRERLERVTEIPADATAEQRLDRVAELLRDHAVSCMVGVMPTAAAGFVMLGLAARLLRDDAEPGELQAVLRGLPHNVTTEMDLALWHAADRVRADEGAADVVREGTPAELSRRYREGTLPPVVAAALEDFLSRYGHRAVAEIDAGMPRWSDDPAHVLGVIGNYLRLDDPSLAPDVQFRRAAATAEEAVTRLVAKARRRSRLRAAVVSRALDRTRKLAGLRELPKFCLVYLLAGVRRQLLAVGAELATAGLLDDANDVCYLDLAELRAAVGGMDLRRLVGERKEEYGHELRRRRVPRVLLSDGTTPEPPRADDGSAGLSGTPASAGEVTAKARVVLDPVGARLDPGEVLVAPSTDPGWTPLFLTAGGLVMEMGGANSHGAVVAREYGIPAVVGVSGATEQLATGQPVTVDGSAGTVRPAASGDVDEVRVDDDVVDVVPVGEVAGAGDEA